MSEKPILFSGAMVQAILAGRKTQTRRVWKNWQPLANSAPAMFRYACPYGKPGDRLWVRETWCNGNGLKIKLPYDDLTATGPDAPKVIYRADNTFALPKGCKWRPAIHMPRWASRLTLEVTDVRIQRLQEISEEDAKAEGIQPSLPVADERWVNSFHLLWNSINAKRGYGWDINPWVWAINFKRI